MTQNFLLGNIDSLLDLLSTIGWILFAIYAVALTLQTIFRRGIVFAFIQLISFRILLPFLLIAGIQLTSLAVVFIEPTQVGVVISVVIPGGVRATPLPPGFQLIVPLLEDVIEYPIFWQTYTMTAIPDEGEVFGDDSIRARTRDGQEIYLDVSIVFRIDRAQAVLVHIDWQNRYIDDFVRPVLQGYVRDEVSQFTVNEVNSGRRSDLQESLDLALREEFASKGFEVDQFLLRDITFSDEYAEAVELKQVALEQELQALFEANRERELARGLADAVEIQAQGQARAIEIEAQAQANAFRLIGEALSENRDLLVYYYIDRLSPSIQTLLVPNNSPLILPLPELTESLGVAPTTTETVEIAPTPTSITPATPVAPATGG
ncbi:MAG: prohibitin family protein [Chloroflexi bacterium]|nr:prohibitin family protein [Chloroflexota bacterium]